ncbi:VOC family protein [Streptomyces panacea]|uniref:VOC family protein n=1 Tax=Streptomyces panacea TaxID=3035064 RepID=UPI00339C8220
MSDRPNTPGTRATLRRVELIERAGSRRPRDVTDPPDACRDQGYGHWALEVDDLDAAFAGLTTAGAQAVRPAGRRRPVRRPLRPRQGPRGQPHRADSASAAA